MDYGDQSYRPLGTAAQHTVLPRSLAVDLPDDVPDELGACLGIPGITAHRAVFSDGPVTGITVLVHGVLGGVGRLGGRPVGERGPGRGRGPEPGRPRRLRHAGGPPQPAFWPMLFNNATLWLLGSDDFPIEAKQQAAVDLTSAASARALRVDIAPPIPLVKIAFAHDQIDAGTRARVLVAVDD